MGGCGSGRPLEPSHGLPGPRRGPDLVLIQPGVHQPQVVSRDGLNEGHVVFNSLPVDVSYSRAGEYKQLASTHPDLDIGKGKKCK